MFEQIKFLTLDIKRWKIHSFKSIFYALFELGIWATVLYRLSRSLYLMHIPIIQPILNIFCTLLNLLSEIICGVRLPAHVEIGPGLYIGHTGTIVIHHNVKIGKNCNISQGITIGQKGEGHDDSVPVIGNNVYIGAGAKVIGGIKIGNGVWIGANAVVLKDLPDHVTAVGIPAVIKKVRNGL